MRAFLLAILVAAAAVAATPPASAAAIDPVVPLCVPPASGNGVCVGTINGNPCVWSWLGPSFRAVCVDIRNEDLLVCDNGGCQSVRDAIDASIAQPDPVCVPPGTLNGVCVGFIAGDLCVWAWLGPSFNAVCLDDEGPDVLLCDNSGCTSVLRVSTTSAAALPVGCTADIGACVHWDVPTDGRECATVHFGFQGAGACASTETGAVRVCSSMRSTLWDGSCPTDEVGQLISLGVDVTCNPDLAGVCVSLHQTGACAGVNFGFQGAGACVDRASGVRVCTSARSIFWDGFCPTDGTILDELIALD